MSLIIAANLVDRIYMCADTRISRSMEKDGEKYFDKVHDDLLKILPVGNNRLGVGCVGTTALGAFLLEKIVGIAGSPIYIRDFRELLEARQDK